MSAPATAIMGYAEMLMNDAVRSGRAALIVISGESSMRVRSLHGLILSLLDRAAVPQTDGISDQSEFRRMLRHNLRTPLNAIKGYGEMLREDVADAGTEAFAVDLDKLLGEATLLLDRIDGLVTYSGADASAFDEVARSNTLIAAPAMMVESLLKAVCPVPANEGELAAVMPSRILVVDDNASNRDLLSRRLQRHRHTILQAEDGATALALVEKEALDLILLDLMMPGINGYDVLKVCVDAITPSVGHVCCGSGGDAIKGRGIFIAPIGVIAENIDPQCGRWHSKSSRLERQVSRGRSRPQWSPPAAKCIARQPACP